MLAKFRQLPPFDCREVRFDLSVPDMDLRQYDWIVVNTSGGKDSITIMRHIVALATIQGVLDRVMSVHCDLKAAEWYGTKELAKAHADYYGIKFVVVTRPQGDLIQDIRHRGKFPARGSRYCTSHHKRGQVLKLFTFPARKTRTEKYKQKVRILNVMGHRHDESCDREQLLPFNPNWKPGQISNSLRQVDYWYPIHHWKVEQTWADIHASNVPYHYAYDLGMTWLSCVFCVFGTKAGFLIAGYYNPELLCVYCGIEEETGFRFQHRLSLTMIRDQLQAGVKPPAASGDWKM